MKKPSPEVQNSAAQGAGCKDYTHISMDAASGSHVAPKLFYNQPPDLLESGGFIIILFPY